MEVVDRIKLSEAKETEQHYIIIRPVNETWIVIENMGIRLLWSFLESPSPHKHFNKTDPLLEY